jgi:hypothetical protein
MIIRPYSPLVSFLLDQTGGYLLTKHEKARSSKLKVKNQAPLNSLLITHYSLLFHADN